MRWLRPLLLVAVSVTVTLLALEAVARVARRWQGRGKEGAEVAQYTEYDPVLGWRKRPGARVVYRRREYDVEVAINIRGLRDPERDYSAPAGMLRLLAIGDSFVEGYTVPLAETVTQVLEATLAREGCPAEVINGGTSGYSTDQELLFYQNEGRRYAPRVVLLFFHYNDIVYNDRQEYFGTPKPAFEMGGGRLRVHRIPVRQRPAQAAATAEAEPETSSAFLEWIRDRMWYGAPKGYNVVARLGLWPPMPQVPTRLELRVYETRRVPEIEDAWAKTAALLAAAHREVAGTGARFLVVYVPSRFEVDEGSWRLSRQLYGWDEAGWDRSQVSGRLSQVGRENGFAVLDLTSPLRHANGGWGPRPYFTYDVHWTRRGHGVAAEEIWRELAGRGWLEACSAGHRARPPGG